MKDIYESLLHVLWGFLPLVIFWGAAKVRRYGPMVLLAGSVTALAFALPRELVDQWPIERPWDTVLDLSMFLLGGLLAGFVMWRVRND